MLSHPSFSCDSYAVAGTLDQSPLAERIADLNGEKYFKPNQSGRLLLEPKGRRESGEDKQEW